jgi:osmotically-inducible protein OsmY
MRSIKRLAITQLLMAAVIATQLTACFPVVVGGAAAGGLMAADRRTAGAYVDDEAIEIKAERNIDEELGDKIHVNVTSYNRNVLITGEAIDEATKAKAESIAKSVANVRGVTNELAISAASSRMERNNDAYITTKVKARMLTEHRFPVNYVKVVTEDSVVYLMGIVTHKEADDAVEIARGTDGVQKVVKVFEYLD